MERDWHLKKTIGRDIFRSDNIASRCPDGFFEGPFLKAFYFDQKGKGGAQGDYRQMIVRVNVKYILTIWVTFR